MEVTRQKAWRLAHPSRYHAHLAVDRAKRRGEIESQPCAVCGNPKSEAHHPDYRFPLKVIWLCRKHHVRLHKKEGRA
ncbi:hypothetical protein EOW65_17680 [Sinirhodobacter ferrireducens]|uniref:HNH endonuclease n=1 Tax=Paenirhodobacter ferrireducens TaxID=1215032 RepID=A0A443L6W5_9RHOB|nr:hypothetical protein [Sinirhodobacter ferrireducens]RWR44975.1 hypothetical protein EOW65_17680 [Sinirhodobacter ferrireducens]